MGHSEKVGKYLSAYVFDLQTLFRVTLLAEALALRHLQTSAVINAIRAGADTSIREVPLQVVQLGPS
jgi:hypothetical protein|tara:strand:- start:36 stop:236 length:201 start_codon:yes stop_codon:yes gene_type:complete